MSEADQDQESLELANYKEITTCYEQLFLIIQSSKGANTNNHINNYGILQQSFTKVQDLIDREMNSHHDGEDELCTRLFVLREHIVGLSADIQKQVALRARAEVPPPIANPVNNMNLVKDVLQGSIDSTRVFPKVKGLHEIAGLSQVKKLLTTIAVLPLRQPQLFKDRKLGNCVLLYGPPGTGKTRIAHALAAEMSGTLYAVNSSDILSHFVGQTEKLVKTLFESVKRPKNSPTVLFMDEIDGLCKRRENSEADWTRRLKTELMCQLTTIEDCPRVLVICATNCPWDIDPAFIRRFQQRVYVPLPNRTERFELLQMFTEGTSLRGTLHCWGPVLDKTEGYSGSDMNNLVSHALNIPVMELTNVSMWKQIYPGVYRPFVSGDALELLVFREIGDMPPGSVLGRCANHSDLDSAVLAVKRTVCEEDVSRYEQFVNGV